MHRNWPNLTELVIICSQLVILYLSVLSTFGTFIVSSRLTYES